MGQVRPTESVLACIVSCALALPAFAHASGESVVRDIRTAHSGANTQILVQIDGPVRFHTRASDDGKSVLVDIEDATIDDGAPRMLPVSDRRVDGIIVVRDAASRVVHLSVDVAGRTTPRFVAEAGASGILLTFTDAGSPPAGLSAAPAMSATVGPVADASPAPRAAVPAIANERVGNRAAARAIANERVTNSTAAPAIARVGNRASSRPAARPAVTKPLVIIDPGHGGKDPGAQAWTGEYEKDIVLDVAERVARRLRKRGDIDVAMTRSGDEFVELADRRDASRRWNADVFVSIHANASKSAAARGFETYYRTHAMDEALSQAPPDRSIRRLARLENAGHASNPKHSPGVASASLTDARQPVADHGAESARLARLVQGELVRQLDLRYEPVRDLGAREGPFFVIGHNAAPSVLVEAAFLTHREEGVRMRSEVYREQIAEGVARGICRFLEEERRLGAL